MLCFLPPKLSTTSMPIGLWYKWWLRYNTSSDTIEITHNGRFVTICYHFEARCSSSLIICGLDFEVLVVLLVWLYVFPSFVYMRTMQRKVDQLHSIKHIPMLLALQYHYVYMCPSSTIHLTTNGFTKIKYSIANYLANNAFKMSSNYYIYITIWS